MLVKDLERFKLSFIKKFLYLEVISVSNFRFFHSYYDQNNLLYVMFVKDLTRLRWLDGRGPF